MIVCNLTIKVSPGIEKEWLQWQKEKVIPAAMATGLFTGWRCFHLLNQDETDGITYVIQYLSPDISHYNRYLETHAPAQQREAHSRWGDQFVSFQTVMEVVN